MVLRGNKEGVAEEKERGKFRLVSFGSQQVMPAHFLAG